MTCLGLAETGQLISIRTRSAPGVVAGQSQIDSFAIDGQRASGTATFVEVNAAYAVTVEPVTGTFEAICAEE